MEWLASSYYAGSLVLYLVVKFYYKNEANISFVYPGCDCCVCGRGLIQTLFSVLCLSFIIVRRPN